MLAAGSEIANRLKACRLKQGLTQRALGVLVGLPEEVAGVRINRYERAVHNFDIETAQKITRALGVSIAYLFAETDQLAELIDEFGKLSGKAQDALLLDVRRKATR
ncbi:helix-turn-helix transcriptional regulator [Stenotrophomonas sp. BIGb0135]|uniref:helix-turn-helix domain-containing protein n=1 Tax=Stenotrophomonas sp. BIGb0135 TaxID=2940620 RepID=UPI002167CCAC|nr:helix-turn-helix transcriptional regulator [Stenotrophomonas sp. BIGb0135]MCS4233428.1 transcriptional regulator with XRE-family HTH domain [Stenotrophomonas sp. BIGb0135]